MRLYAVLALILAGTFLSFFSPVYAACLFLWHDIFQPFEFAYGDLSFSTANLVFIILMLSYFFTLVKGSFKPSANPFIFLTGLFLLWAFVCAMMSPFAQAMDGVLTIAKYLLPLVLISTTITKRNDAILIAGILALSVGIWSAQAGVKGLTSGMTKNMAIPGGQMTDNNDFMVATVSIIPLLTYFALNYAWRFRKAVKSILFLMIALCISAIVFSNSRGAAVGLTVTLLFYLAMVSTHRVRDLSILIVLCVCGYYLLPDEFFQRMSTVNLSVNQTEDSAAERMIMTLSAWHASLRSPIFGYGPSCWLLIAPEFSGGRSLEPHNHWMKLSSEMGFVGVACFLLVFGYTIFRLFAVRKRANRLGDKISSRFSMAMITSLFGFLSAATFVSHPYSEFLWALFAVANGFTSNFFRRLRHDQVPKRTRPRTDGKTPTGSGAPPNPDLAMQ